MSWMGDMTLRQDFFFVFKINFGDFSQKRKAEGGKKIPSYFLQLYILTVPMHHGYSRDFRILSFTV